MGLIESFLEGGVLDPRAQGPFGDDGGDGEVGILGAFRTCLIEDVGRVVLGREIANVWMVRVDQTRRLGLVRRCEFPPIREFIPSNKSLQEKTAKNRGDKLLRR